MSSIKETLQREPLLRELGFKSYKKYLESDIWNLIRKGVLTRDECRCRNLNCKNGKKLAKQVHHLTYSRSVLLGINPGCLITLCSECHKFVEFDEHGNRRDPIAVRNWTFYLASHIRAPVRGVSNSKIGQWYKNQWNQNRLTARIIFRKMKEEQPEWFEMILEQIKSGKVSLVFAEYLGIKVRVKKRAK